MDCPKCKEPMIKIEVLGEYFCPECTICPNCGNGKAVVSNTLGVLPCDDCHERFERQKGRKLGGWKSNQYLQEYASTPFWKHMGLKPTKEEKAQEKEMKRRGLSYHDLSMMRNSGKNANFNNEELVKKALKGELKDGHQASGYGRQRAAGDSSKTSD